MLDHPLYSKVATFCARAERCPQEVRLWLEKRGVPSEEREEILEELIGEYYVDEKRYIAAYASDKLRFNERGPLRIKQELLARELPEELVESIVDRVMEENDYRKVLATILHKKLLSLDSQAPETIQKKVFNWVYSKGFEWDDILDVAKQILSL